MATGPSASTATATATAIPNPSPESASVAEPEARLTQAEAVIHRNVLWSLGAGLLPIPVLDVAVVTAVELKMLKELSAIYQVEFSHKIAQKIIYSLLVSAGAVGVGCLVGSSLSKFIPLVGTTLGVVSGPVLIGAFTHGLGRVFLMHFESGGTLLDFDAVAMRQYFKAEFEKGREVAAALKQQGDRSKAETKSS